MLAGSGGDRLDHGFVGADNGEEVAAADDLDRLLGGPADRGFVDRDDRCAPPRLPDHACMQHAVERHVVNEGLLAEHFGGEIDPRRAAADQTVGGGFLVAARPVAGTARSTAPRSVQ